MIERLYFRDLVTFSSVELEFDQGLVVFTGPSGAGKSVLISSILTAFGHTTKGAASLCEVLLKKPEKLKSEAYVLDDEITIKSVKKEKLRYFVDGQNISKKGLIELFSPYVKHLSVRDKGGFESEVLVELIDTTLSKKDKNFKKLLREYKKRFITFKEKQNALFKIKEDELKLSELIEFTKYEIEKIEKIAPKIDEEEELLQIKQQLSRIDKIRDALANANEIFNFESSVEEVYRLLDKDCTLFSDTMNQLRADFEESEKLADNLEEVDVEEVLDRLADLGTLKSRYGSIEEALTYKEEKERELAGYSNIEKDKSFLENFLEIEERELMILASKLSQSRKKESKNLEKVLKDYLETLKLTELIFNFSNISLGENGFDKIEAHLGNSSIDTLSGGEFNRVRLALMAATMVDKESKSKDVRGILILDEIDANVSGDESIAIADMIAKLSTVYQIFAISHQPHLSAKADQHIVVTKSEKESIAEVLDEEGRVKEIARIVAGERANSQAIEFAKKLRGV